jgi:hypothetical protein
MMKFASWKLNVEAENQSIMHKKCKTKRKWINFNKNLACKLQMKMAIANEIHKSINLFCILHAVIRQATVASWISMPLGWWKKETEDDEW